MGADQVRLCTPPDDGRTSPTRLPRVASTAPNGGVPPYDLGFCIFPWDMIENMVYQRLRSGLSYRS